MNNHRHGRRRSRSRSPPPPPPRMKKLDAFEEIIQEHDELRKQVSDLKELVLQMMTTLGQQHDMIELLKKQPQPILSKQLLSEPKILIVFIEHMLEAHARTRMLNMIDNVKFRKLRVWKDDDIDKICGDYEFSTVEERESAFNYLRRYESGLIKITRKN